MKKTAIQISMMENDNHIMVKRICASCQHREILDDGTRICAMMQLKVKQKFVCPKWQMSDGLKNAGLQTGGVVLRKRSGIAERA